MIAKRLIRTQKLREISSSTPSPVKWNNKPTSTDLLIPNSSHKKVNSKTFVRIIISVLGLTRMWTILSDTSEWWVVQVQVLIPVKYKVRK